MLRSLPPRFDPSASDVRTDPYPTYAALRAAAPLCRGAPGQWVVTRHDDVAALLADPRLGNALPEPYHRLVAGDGAAAAFLRRILLYRDRPDHPRIRALMAPAFTPTALRRLESRVERLVRDLLEPAAERGVLEAVDDLAFPLPATVVCELIGIPAADRDAVRPRAFEIGRALAASVGTGDRGHVDDAVDWLRALVGRLLDERARRPADDLLSAMLEANRNDPAPLPREDVVDNVVFLFFAGFETTASMLATGCAALLDHPAELRRLRTDPGLVPAAVEEFLRFDAPIQSRLRHVLEPVEVGGRRVRPGRSLLLLLGSANHDGAVFEAPDRLDVGRDPNPHLSFGGGSHYCLGARLARLEGRIAFRRLLERFDDLAPAAPAERDPASAFRTYARVPIAVRPAGRRRP